MSVGPVELAQVLKVVNLSCSVSISQVLGNIGTRRKTCFKTQLYLIYHKIKMSNSRLHELIICLGMYQHEDRVYLTRFLLMKVHNNNVQIRYKKPGSGKLNVTTSCQSNYTKIILTK